MSFRFYNGGNSDSLTLPYSVGDRNAFYYIRIKEREFFEVPETIKINGVPHWTQFDSTIPTRKAQFGIVRVDPNAEETSITGRIARTDEEARKLGDEIHQEYLITLAQDYQNRVESFKAQGLTPLPAQGYVKYALKALNLADPAEPVRNQVEKAAEGDRVAALEKQIADLTKLINRKGQ